MTCRSCLHSAERFDGVLWCCQFGKPARAICVAWLYEPGTDESDRA